METDERSAVGAWSALDATSQEALRLAWEAFQTGNIGVGAVITDPTGEIVATGRNRVMDGSAPPGEVAGCSLAHAEVNALAHLAFRAPCELTLTTSLQPCFQCAAAIRMAPIAHLRILGADPLWDGCHDFTGLNPWLARRAPIPVEGPRRDEIGAFSVLTARMGPGLLERLHGPLRERGEGPLLDLVLRLQGSERFGQLAGRSVEQAFEDLWDDLRQVVARSSSSAPAGTSGP